MTYLYVLKEKIMIIIIIIIIVAAGLYFSVLQKALSLLRYERSPACKEKHYRRSIKDFSSLSKVLLSQQTLGKESMNLYILTMTLSK